MEKKSKAATNAALLMQVHTVLRPKEHTLLWLNVSLQDCGVMRVRTGLYIEIALIQQFLNSQVCMGVSHQSLTEVSGLPTGGC